jgi:maltooligosyltrehalose trehalohydrolase
MPTTERPRGGPARRLPVGAEVVPGGTSFRVWAPRRRRVEVVRDGGPSQELAEEGGRKGYFAGTIEGMGAGDRYRLRLDGESDLYPDPISRFQPEGPHGPSEVVDPTRFRWTDGSWRGLELRGQVFYEMHVGTFTPEGTWAAATARLETLREICTAIEMMPVAEFSGDFGWGYDGVDLFAPTHLYGRPDDLRAFVDRAHALGLGVILDVVYNHLGPDGNYLAQFSDTFFSRRHSTEWGAAINYDGEGSSGVREAVLANAEYWVDEFRFDGLRLDATQAILDDSTPHVLREIGERVRECARGRGCGAVVVAENEPQDARLVRAIDDGGYGLDGVWNDDFHHSSRVALTGRTQAYFTDHRGSPQEFLSAAKHGYLFQGQRYHWQKKPRGTSTRGVAPERFVTFVENHDQVANTGRGTRLNAIAQPGRMRAMTALFMLGPGTPMLFQGEEFASSAPFLYFAHHGGELAAAVRKGRSEFLAQFPSLALDEMQKRLDDPANPATFARCKLDWGERERHVEALALHRDLFELRRTDPTVRAQGAHGMDGAVLGASSFVLRLFGPRDTEDRLLLVNLGRDERLVPAPEPLLAPPHGSRWRALWTSDDVRYGGDGTPPPDTDEGWIVSGESTVLLAPEANST